MIVRNQKNGELVLIGQTDHSRLAGLLSAHWGNEKFATPTPYHSVVRAAVFHDYGWLRYETGPVINPETGETYEFRQLPFSQKQLDAYQWCVDWLNGIDRYSALLVSKHRTGLWKGRYGHITHPAANYNPQYMRAEITDFIERVEPWQQQEEQEVGGTTFWTNYELLQVWDLLGLYFCCQEPYSNYIEPVPTSYPDDAGVTLTMEPAGARQVAFDPYPFDVRPLRVQISSKRLPLTRYADQETFTRAYFQAPTELIEYELV